MRPDVLTVTSHPHLSPFQAVPLCRSAPPDHFVNCLNSSTASLALPLSNIWHLTSALCCSQIQWSSAHVLIVCVNKKLVYFTDFGELNVIDLCYQWWNPFWFILQMNLYILLIYTSNLTRPLTALSTNPEASTCGRSVASLIHSSPVKPAGSAEKNQPERWMWNAVNFPDFPVTHVMIPFALPLQANLDIYQKFDEIMLQRPENIFLCCKPEAWGSTAAAQGPVATMRPLMIQLLYLWKFRYWRQ